MKVVSDEGYLLVKPLEGIAYNPPAPFKANSKA